MAIGPVLSGPILRGRPVMPQYFGAFPRVSSRAEIETGYGLFAPFLFPRSPEPHIEEATTPVAPEREAGSVKFSDKGKIPSLRFLKE
jgi:hypothetical protein